MPKPNTKELTKIVQDQQKDVQGLRAENAALRDESSVPVNVAPPPNRSRNQLPGVHPPPPLNISSNNKGETLEAVEATMEELHDLVESL